MKLSTKLVIQCGLLGLLPALVGVYFAHEGTTNVLETYTELVRQVADYQGDKIDRNLLERYGDVKVFAGLTAARDPKNWYKVGDEANPITQRMNQFVADYGVYTMTMLVDLDGKVAAINTRDPHGNAAATQQFAGRNYRDASWFIAAAAEQFTIDAKWAAKEHHGVTGAHVELQLDSPVAKALLPKSEGRAVVFSAPVEKDGKVVAVWMNVLDIGALDEIIEETAGTMGLKNLQIAVVDAEGNVVISSQVTEKKLTGLGAKEAVAGENKAWIAEGADGEAYVVAARTLDGAANFPGLGWSMVVRTQKNEVAADALADARKADILQIGLMVLIIGAAIFVARHVAKPVAAMAAAADQIAQGNLEVEVTHHGKDEIGQLADSFRSMVGYLDGVAKAAEAVSRGDLTSEVTARSDKDQLSLSVARVVSEVRRLVSEVGGLSSMATMGHLEGRLAVDQFSGAYQDVARGVNQMLDAMLAPVAEATKVLERMAARDFTTGMVGDYQGDHARLKNALNVALGNVRTGLLQVARGAEQVKAASSQIASGSQSLASGASEQAAALTETRSTLEGVASMTERNAANAEKASMLAGNAHDVSGTGATAMKELAEAVGRIRGTVMNTAEIIRDINQIAFQTNLLALNAAVEAARAGDAGRGFAVVADEVRNLAQQAKGAAHKTEELLRGAIAQAEQGESISKQVNTGLNEIVEAVESVDQIIKEIASASREQAMGVHQVTEATSQMDQVTHQNAASSEELSSTAEELSAQALELTAMVAHFRLEEGTRAPAPRAPSAMAPAPRSEAPAGGVSAHQLIPFDDQVELRDF